MKETVQIREALESDREFVLELMDSALSPYYGGDHKAHALRIFSTHISGGVDSIGHFSSEQKMFILTLDEVAAGMIHIVGKRQDTYKISPLILAAEHRGKSGLGSRLLLFAEEYAMENGARQIYCTVAEENTSALQFFLKKGYVPAGRSPSHYKEGITEVMLYKLCTARQYDEQFDREHISVIPCETHHKLQVQRLLLDVLPENFRGVDERWVTALFDGYDRRSTGDVNTKFKLIFVAEDRTNTVLGVAGATPKKGEPIKLMPCIANTIPAFVALLTDIPFVLKEYGRKLYIHITPSVEQTVALQRRGWRLDAAMPAAYHQNRVTQQWSFDISGDDFMRFIRVKQRFLKEIRDGTKTLEVRVGYENIKAIQRGERIRFISGSEEQIIRIRDVRHYPDFDEMLSKEDASRIASGLSKDAVRSLLKEIYPENKEKLGVIVFDIQPEERHSISFATTPQ
jgi:ASC-1-like (ASCH) protein/GNAT superfamily N-acetyltransferase